jgi:hypothetical protein
MAPVRAHCDAGAVLQSVEEAFDPIAQSVCQGRVALHHLLDGNGEL